MEDIHVHLVPPKKKKKRKHINRSEEDVSFDYQSSERELDSSLTTVTNSDENTERKRKKKKKHKKDHDKFKHDNEIEHANELTVDENVSEIVVKHKTKKKKKKNSKKGKGLPCVYGITHQKQHMNREAGNSSPSKRNAENRLSNSAGPSEIPEETDSSPNGEVDPVDDGETVAEKTTKKSSSKSSEQRKKSRRKSIELLTLTEEDAAIVHSGKFSSCKEDIEKFKKMGISLRVGKWLPQEDDILMENFESLKNDTQVDIDNAFLMQILFTNLIGCVREELTKVRAFLRKSSFNVRLAGNLRRTTESVLDRARKILPSWNTGPFTNREEAQLVKLVEEYGNQWTLIGFHLNRSRNSVLDHYQIIKDHQRKKGKWTEDETNDLLQVISEVMQEDDLLSLPHFNMPWNRIGQKMANRNGKQCRSHWVYHVRPMLVQGTNSKITLKKEDVVEEILKLDIETESEIDWVALMEKIPEAGTPQQLMYLWQKIKSIIPGVDRMTFDEIRDALEYTSFDT